MSLSDALNTRANGAVGEDHFYVPPAIAQMTEDAEARVVSERAAHKPAFKYSDTALIEALGRMAKAAPFMQSHLYDKQGGEQIDRFVQLCHDLQNLAVLHRAQVIFSAE